MFRALLFTATALLVCVQAAVAELAIFKGLNLKENKIHFETDREILDKRFGKNKEVFEGACYATTLLEKDGWLSVKGVKILNPAGREIPLQDVKLPKGIVVEVRVKDDRIIEIRLPGKK